MKLDFTSTYQVSIQRIMVDSSLLGKFPLERHTRRSKNFHVDE